MPFDADTPAYPWDDDDRSHAEEAARRLLDDTIFRTAVAALIRARLNQDGVDCTVEAE